VKNGFCAFILISVKSCQSLVNAINKEPQNTRYKQNVLKSKYLNDLLIIPTIWFALFTCVWICFSKLSFASIVTPMSWNPYKTKDIEVIENVQRRATKMLPDMKDLTCEERLRKPECFEVQIFKWSPDYPNYLICLVYLCLDMFFEVKLWVYCNSNVFFRLECPT
jgi:hypothetical protein